MGQGCHTQIVAVIINNVTLFNKKLIRRGDSERELTLRRHGTCTTKHCTPPPTARHGVVAEYRLCEPEAKRKNITVK